MRGLFNAALVLAPALAFAYAVPDVAVEKVQGHAEPVADHSIALVDVEIGSRSPDDALIQTLPFHLKVLPSEQACGYGNITVNGRVLPQTLEGDVSTGTGPILMPGKGIILASWSFQCVKVKNEPDSQFLNLVVNVIDGKPVGNTGLSVVFKQTGTAEIIKVNTDLSVSESVAASPDPEALPLAGEDVESIPYNVEDEMAELDWMYAQLHELKLMIVEKHEAIAAHAWEHSASYEEDIKHCDSLKCVLNAVFCKVKHTASDVYEQLTGEDEFPDEKFGHFAKPPFRKPHWPKIPKIPFHPGKGKSGNHTCGPPKHGKHNHTHPPPHHRKPHHFLPICRLPPHHVPHHPPPQGPPSYNFHPRPPPNHQEPLHDPNFPPTPPASFPSSIDTENSPLPPPPADPPQDPPKHHNSLHKALRIVQYTVIGFLAAFLLIALHRRACTPSKRADRKARREERRRRRAFRHAAHKHAISRLLSRMSGDRSDHESSDDYDEKRAALLSDAEDRMSSTMTDEIAEFRNAASIVDDIVSAEEGRARTVAYAHGLLPEPIPIPAHEREAVMREYDLGGQISDGEELPAYEDNYGSDMSSVADGFRYTPGSSDYSPQYSASGSVDDVLGPDTKT